MNKTFYRILIASLLGTYSIATAQTGTVGIGTLTPNNNAVLHLESGSTAPQGFLMPRLDKTRFIGIGLSSDENGLLFYDTQSQQFYYWKDPNWVALATSEQITTLSKQIAAVWLSGAGIPANTLGEEGSYYLDTTTNLLYKKENGTYQLLSAFLSPSTSANGDLSGTFLTLSIKPGVISTDKLANGSVTTDKVSLNTITTGHLTDKAVTNAKIADLAITTDKIAPGTANSLLTTDNAGTTVKWVPATTLFPTLSDAQLWIGNSGTPTPITFSKDVRLNKLGETTVEAIQGHAVATATPTDKDVLTWDGTLQKWVPKAPAVSPAASPTQYYSIDPIEFVQTDNTSSQIYFDGKQGRYARPVNGGEKSFATALHLPHGATVTAIAFLCKDQNSLEDIEVAFVKTTPFTAPGYVQIGVTQSAGSSSGIQTLSLSPSEVVDNQNYSYKLVITTKDNNNHLIYGARITYTF